MILIFIYLYRYLVLQVTSKLLKITTSLLTYLNIELLNNISNVTKKARTNLKKISLYILHSIGFILHNIVFVETYEPLFILCNLLLIIKLSVKCINN